MKHLLLVPFEAFRLRLLGPEPGGGRPSTAKQSIVYGSFLPCNRCGGALTHVYISKAFGSEARCTKCGTTIPPIEAYPLEWTRYERPSPLTPVDQVGEALALRWEGQRCTLSCARLLEVLDEGEQGHRMDWKSVRQNALVAAGTDLQLAWEKADFEWRQDHATFQVTDERKLAAIAIERGLGARVEVP